MVAESVDTRGLFCPLPITFVSRKLKVLEVGEELEVLADDKAFQKDVEIWSQETGNTLLGFREGKGYYIARIRRGAGYKGERIWDKIKFISIGIKLHATKTIRDVIPIGKPKYLLTFVSVAEGLRSHKWLKEEGFTNYTLLPVPKAIYPRCGVVLGFREENESLQAYDILKCAKFAVEDIHLVIKGKRFPQIKPYYTLQG